MEVKSTGAEFGVQHFIDQIKKNRSNLTKTVEKAAKIRPNGGGAPKVIEHIKASNGNTPQFNKVSLLSKIYMKTKDFSGQDLQGADFRGKDLRGAIFDNCDLTDAMFDGARLEGASFQGATLKGASCKGATLKGASCKGAIFDGSDLTNAMFDGALLERSSFKNVIAITATFIEAKMNDADLSGSDFRNSDFTKAKMQRSTLSEATFREADLENADARDANFDGTQLGDGYMRGFNMEGAKIGNVHVFGNFKNAFDGAIMKPDDEDYLKALLDPDYVPGAQPKRKRGEYEFEPKAKRQSDDKMSFGTRQSGDSDSLVQPENSAVTSDHSYSEVEESAGANDKNTSPMM
ncbi:Secreted effector protein pipB2 [Labrenzia sp. THAF82]|uniref:pentapeptide repeat-containing protein n=1 Tax=Labrenzia sp. THAF82 TaxID=2587861 RepID=UPI001267D8E9|nr:pentapeptide repeat-containing protein [Labrenzia sp. THAF82]QFT29417.1 Secreted effector protein pipB2 [Labrenzia sp. THAF82]